MDGSLTAYTSLGIGLLILYTSIFTLTISHWSLPYFRLAVAPTAIISFWKFGYGPYDEPTLSSPTVSLYFILRVLEHSVITFWDANPPHWVKRAQSTDRSRVVVSLPSTFWTRCVYAFDLLTSLRGLSWFSDLEWSWVSHSHQPHAPISRRRFIFSNIRSFLTQYLIFDLCDTLLQSRTWDAKSPHPMTDLPVVQQTIFSTILCGGTFISMSLSYTLVSTVFVLCGSDPAVWPPLFDSPFSSKSLQDFWSRRWHSMFRHVFERLSLPFTQILLYNLSSEMRPNRRLVRVVRCIIAFAHSTILHLIIMHRLAFVATQRAGRTDIPKPAFFDRSVVAFFLFQPLGLAVESIVVTPLADWMFPAHSDNHTTDNPITGTPSKRQTTDSMGSASYPPIRWEKDLLTRMYVWIFIIWTGRWWCDAWTRASLLDKEIKAVHFSPLRGLWEGRWVI